MNEQTILNLNWSHYFVELIIFAITFLFFSLGILIDFLIYGYWNTCTDVCYKDKQIKHVDKRIITASIEILRFFIDILVIWFGVILWEALNDSFYTKSISLNAKTHLTTSSSVVIVYLYKLILVILTSQYVLAILPLIMVQIAKYIRRKQKLVGND